MADSQSATPPPRRRWRRNIVRLACALAMLPAGTAGLYAANLVLHRNFHTVEPGQLYRSAQPEAGDISAWHRDFGIRTILNLRGEHAGDRWYDTEVAEARQNGVAVIDFAMSAKHVLTQEQARQLVALMRDAPKPLLIHCRGGADRTGLASALYSAAIRGDGEDAAEAQMSLRYGHFSVPVLKTFAMDRSFEHLEPWLGYEGS